MKCSAHAAILLAAGLVAGCSTSQPPLSQKMDYQSERPKLDNPLEVPPDLTSVQTQNRYNIPANEVAQALGNAGTVAVNKLGSLRIEREGNQRWLVVGDRSPEQLWPVLKAFWQDTGFIITSEDQLVGVMETDWAENRAKLPNDGLRKLLETVGLGSVYSTGERDKFRIRLEKTSRGTEVYFSHRGMEEVYSNTTKDSTIWQPRSSDPNLEAELLGRFMIRLGLGENKAQEMIQQTLSPAKAPSSPIVDGRLRLNDTFDRAWRRTGLALDRIGLVVNDRDRSQGLYFVRPAKNDADKGESGGFWSSLAFWRSKDKQEQIAPSGPEFRVQLQEVEPGVTSVVIQNKQGQLLSDEFSKAALTKLQSELQ